jgi:hypothetical protein
MRFESLALILASASIATAFSTLDNGSSKIPLAPPALSVEAAAAASPRRAFLQQLGAAAGSASVLAFSRPRPAAAYVASAAAMDPSVAMRTVKTSLRRLQAETFADYVAFNEYEALRKALRDSPFSEIRKSCTSLIRTASSSATTASSDGDAAASAGSNNSPVADDLSAKYRKFIASMERMDATASVATRGRQLEPGELKAAYSDTVSALQEFLGAAQEAVDTSGALAASLSDGLES